MQDILKKQMSATRKIAMVGAAVNTYMESISMIGSVYVKKADAMEKKIKAGLSKLPHVPAVVAQRTR